MSNCRWLTVHVRPKAFRKSFNEHHFSFLQSFHVLWCSWFRSCATIWDVPESTPARAFGNLEVNYFCLHSVALVSTQPLTEIPLGGKVRPERRTGKPAILVVPHVTVRIKTQDSTSL